MDDENLDDVENTENLDNSENNENLDEVEDSENSLTFDSSVFDSFDSTPNFNFDWDQGINDLFNPFDSNENDNSSDSYEDEWEKLLAADNKNNPNPKTAEDLYFDNLQGNNGKTAQDQSFDNLKDQTDKNISLETKAEINGFKNFNEEDMKNENYKELVEDAKKGFEEHALNAIQTAANGKNDYAKLVNERAVEQKNALGGSAQISKENRENNKENLLQSLANNSSRSNGIFGNAKDSLKAVGNNLSYNAKNIGDEIYTAVGGVNSHGNTWSDTHGGNTNRTDENEKSSNQSWISRVGSNIIQAGKNAIDKVDVAFGGADNDTGKSKFGLNADRNFNGKVSFGERLTNIAQSALMGKGNGQKYDLNKDGKVDFKEGLKGTIANKTDWKGIGDKTFDSGKELMTNNGGKWYNSVLGAAKMVGGGIANALQGISEVAVNPLSGASMAIHGLNNLASKGYGIPSLKSKNESNNNNFTSSFNFNENTSNDNSPTTIPKKLSMPTLNDKSTLNLMNAVKASLKTNAGTKSINEGWDSRKLNEKRKNATSLSNNQVALSDERIKQFVIRGINSPKTLSSLVRLIKA